MSKPLKELVKIGDSFENWTVFAKEINEQKYNYNFMCKCTCGATRIITKHRILNNNLPVCDECRNNAIIEQKYELVKKMWHNTLNRCEVPKPRWLDANTSYWFTCEQGHTYKTSICALVEGMCPVCVQEQLKLKNMEKLDKNYNKLVDYLDELLPQFFEGVAVVVDDKNHLIKITLESVNFQILAYPKHHAKFDSMIHKDKEEFFMVNDLIKSLGDDLDVDKYSIVKLELDLNILKDIELIKNVLIDIIS